MPTTIKLKNSVTTTNVPSSLAQGEVAINVTDKKVWVGNAATTPVQLLGTGSDSSFTNLTVSGTTALNGGTTLGDASGDALTINSSAVSIPNGLNFDSNTFVIDATNNRVGVGTSSPSNLLSVFGADVEIGNGSNNGKTTIGSFVGTSSQTDIKSGGFTTFTTFSGGAFGERMRIDSSGNVGIGTSSPSTRFDVGSSSAIVSKFSSTQSQVFLQMVPTSGAVGYVGVDASNVFMASSVGATGIKFKVNLSAPDNSATIDSSGNLLVGTTSTIGASQEILTVRNINAGAWGIAVGNSAGSSTSGCIGFYNSNGRVGSVTTNGTTTLYNVTSDQRLKTNIVNAPSGNIDSIKVRSFDWKSDNSHVEYGFIAQELLEVASYAVYQPLDAEEMMAVDYSKLVPMMIKEIQDLKQRIKTLESK